MKSLVKKFFVLVAILTMTLGACSISRSDGNNTLVPTTPASTGDVIPTTISAPDPAEVAQAYLDAWTNLDYVTMYNLLTTLSKDSIRIEDFDTRYRYVAQEAVINSIEYEVLQVLANPTSAQVLFRVTLNSSLVGAITRDTQMALSLESGLWRVVWDDTLILPELAGGNELSMEAIWPTRGIIYDRHGTVLAADTEAVAVSVIPSNLGDKGGRVLLARIQELSGVHALFWEPLILGDDAPYQVPIGEIPRVRWDELWPDLEPHIDVLSWTSYFTRLAYQREAGAHVLGWVGAVPVEMADDWLARGYPIDATVGRMGIEDWGQEYLAGKPSANLYVRTSAKEVVTILSSREAEPSYSIYTTLDANLQLWAQLALRDFTGAVVVLERDTGRVLAMASSPSFNPNHSNPDNPFSVLWGTYFDGTYAQPMFNRAAMGQYPPGSIFKLISLAAALETGEFVPNQIFDCQHFWYGPDDSKWEDWTYEKGRNPSGVLNMMEGLMRSCNPLFYEIGYKLLISDHGNAITDMAREFGLGSITGIGVIPEEPGNIISPEEISSIDGTQLWVNAIQQAIGQSKTTITPLQAAAYIAAIGNGGTLYQPQLIERVENTAGEAILAFEPVVNNTLPLSDETMAALWEGLLLVTKNTRGTAYATFGRVNFPIAVYGKTGTASVGGGLDPHAWFIGFTDQPEDPLLPDIAVAVVVENMGDGSEFAAPIFRRVVEAYFYTSPTYKYPWESSLFIYNPEYFPTEGETEGGE